jgi:integrase
MLEIRLLSQPAGRWRFGPPKTDRGYRTVPLADFVVDALAAHLAEHGQGEAGMILHRPDGTAVRSHIFENAWAQTRKTAGLGSVDADVDGGGRPG